TAGLTRPVAAKLSQFGLPRPTFSGDALTSRFWLTAPRLCVAEMILQETPCVAPSGEITVDHPVPIRIDGWDLADCRLRMLPHAFQGEPLSLSAHERTL